MRAPVCFVSMVLWGVANLCGSRPAVAAEYTIKNIGNLGILESFGVVGHTYAADINDSGQVVGHGDVEYRIGEMLYQTTHAFLYDGQTIHDLTSTPGTIGYRGSAAYGIANNGAVTGYGDAPDPNAFARYAFVYAGGSLQTIDPTFAYEMSGYDLNDAGQLVGSYTEFRTPNTLQGTAFLFDGAAATRMPTLGGWGTSANDINEQGLITGASEINDNGQAHAYIYDGATMRDLGTLADGMYDSAGAAINALGQVTGVSRNSNLAEHAFYYDGATMHDLGTLGGVRSVGNDINDHGQIVGTFYAADGYLHGFLYDPVLGMRALDELIDPALGWIITEGVGINNVGQIVVNAYRPGETTSALVLTPVPEPGTVVLALVAVMGFSLAGLRRRKLETWRTLVPRRDVVLRTTVFAMLALSPAFAARGGQIVAWGTNSHGQLDMPAGNDFVAIAAGDTFGLALRSGGTLVGWGDDRFGATNVPAGNNFQAVAAGYNTGRSYGLALRTDGSLLAWGNEDYHGTGVTNPYGLLDVPAGHDFVAIAAGNFHCVALRADGSLVAWGAENYSQLSPNTGPLPVPAGNDFVALAPGVSASPVALRADGSLVEWGNDFYRAQVPMGMGFAAVAGGGFQGLALRANGSLAAWGDNSFGQKNVPAGNDFVAASAGLYARLALRSDGSLAGWGFNGYGQLNVPAGHDFTAISAGGNFDLALRAVPEPGTFMLVLAAVAGLMTGGARSRAQGGLWPGARHSTFFAHR